MITAETANKWIGEAEADDRLKPLMGAVEQAYELRVKIVEGPEWESSVKDGKAVIGVAETNRPMAAFAHELLHLCLSARGYRHILLCGNHDPRKRYMAMDLLEALDNELQHHRMFPEFVAAGFDGSDFYADGDDIAHGEMKRTIDAITKNDTPSKVLLSYLTLIAPGGGWSDGSLDELLKLLQRKCSTTTWAKLLEIKDLIEKWREEESLDPTETIVSIFETLGDLDGTFVGESVTGQGAFIPRSMTREEFDKLASSN